MILTWLLIEKKVRLNLPYGTRLSNFRCCKSGEKEELISPPFYHNQMKSKPSVDLQIGQQTDSLLERI